MSQGLVKNNPANDPDKKPVKARSHFKPNVSVYQTVRFGEATPFYGAEVVPDDENFSIRVNSDVDTLTLKSPMMAPVRMNKDYFYVPIRAILPINADKLVTNPLTGDDVVANDVNCMLNPCDVVHYICAHQRDGRFNGSLPYNIQTVGGRTPDATYTVSRLATHLLGFFFLFYRKSWMFLSEGSALRSLGYNFHQLFTGPRKSANFARLTFDQFCEEYFSWITRYIESFMVTVVDGISAGNSSTTVPVTKTTTYTVYPGQVPDNVSVVNVIGLREFIYLLQQGSVPNNLGSVYFTAAGQALGNDLFPFNPWAEENIAVSVWNNWNVAVYTDRSRTTVVNTTDEDSIPRLNMSRAIAYQLACQQFYTSDAVDYIYSPELWHENQKSLALLAIYNWSESDYTFKYNGVQTLYDDCSGAIMRLAANFTARSGGGYPDRSSSQDDWYAIGLTSQDVKWICFDFYFSNLFGINRSLKFRDYFVGSKKAPMAVGNVNVTVTSGEFSVVDVTKNILRQRFLNQVNRVGRTLKEYSQGIFGATPMRDPHECVFLGGTSDIIGAEETQNTGSQQTDRFSMTSRLRSESSKFAFEGSFSEFGVVLGILTFDVARPYVNSCDHALFHADRFDMFNPFMQNIGDQAVLGRELDLHQAQNFGYQLRYMEYRQRVDYCAGGFHKYLPGYAFLADERNIASRDSVNIEISPDFIRSRSFEFDDFYTALPFFSPAGYFHFIIRHDIDVDANRPMLAAPSIL